LRRLKAQACHFCSRVPRGQPARRGKSRGNAACHCGTRTSGNDSQNQKAVGLRLELLFGLEALQRRTSLLGLVSMIGSKVWNCCSCSLYVLLKEKKLSQAPVSAERVWDSVIPGLQVIWNQQFENSQLKPRSTNK